MPYFSIFFHILHCRMKLIFMKASEQVFHLYIFFNVLTILTVFLKLGFHILHPLSN